jgi:hypothetical protein
VHVFKKIADAFGDVQVVIDMLDKFLDEVVGYRLDHQVLVRIRGYLSEPDNKVVDALQRRCRLVYPFEGEVKLFAVVRRNKQVAYGARRIALFEQVAKRVEVPLDLDIVVPSTRRCSTWIQ